MLVMRGYVDARDRHPVTWSKRPSRHSRASEQGTMMILVTLQFSINDSVALVPRISAKPLAVSIEFTTITKFDWYESVHVATGQQPGPET
jgi:hypothetical protein